MLPLLLLLLAQSGYSFPESALTRNDGINAATPLERSDTLRLWYLWQDVSKKIRIYGQKRDDPQDPWVEFDESETVAYRMTAVAPRYNPGSSGPKVIYVIGVNSEGVTIVEKWIIVFQGFLGGVHVSAHRTLIMESASLTHLRALAVDPSQSFLLAQHHETGDILRIDLAAQPPVVTTAVSAQSWPNLALYDVLEWERHVSQGDVFILSQGRSLARSHAMTTAELSRMMLWDTDLDGYPSVIEELTHSEYDTRGYYDPQNWVPPFTWQQ